MNLKTPQKKIATILLTVILLCAWNAQACPACYGADHSSRIDGMNAAIITMIGITGLVLTGISSVFFSIRKRSRLSAIDDPNLISSK